MSSGYFPVPYDFTKALCLAPLTGAELKVVLAVIQRTWGMGKKQNEVSYGKLSDMTKLHRQTVIKAVKSLVAYRLLVVVYRLPLLCLELETNSDKWVVVHRLLGSPQTTTKKRKKRTPKKVEEDELFEQFWVLYPKRIARVTALRAWNKLSRKDKEGVIKGLGKALKSREWAQEKGKFVPHPSTFLNQRRWEDEYTPKRTQIKVNIEERNKAKAAKCYAKHKTAEYMVCEDLGHAVCHHCPHGNRNGSCPCKDCQMSPEDKKKRLKKLTQDIGGNHGS